MNNFKFRTIECNIKYGVRFTYLILYKWLLLTAYFKTISYNIFVYSVNRLIEIFERLKIKYKVFHLFF